MTRFILLLTCGLLSTLAIADITVFTYGEDESRPPVRIVGDQDYPPIEWLDGDKAKGIFPSVLPELARAMNRRIEYRLMDWKQAQKAVLAGEADVLTVFSPNEARIKDYDFVDGFLQFEMSLFVRDDNLTIHGLDDLEGVRTGVTKGGYLRNFLRENSQTDQVIVKDHPTGFQQLRAGELEAFATTKWVGAYSIQKHKIRGIKYVEPPIHIKPTHMGVRKGNTRLRAELNLAIKQLKRDGTIQRLTDQWEKHEIIYLTQGRVQSLLLAGIGLFIAFLFVVALITIYILRSQVKSRTRSLQKANHDLAQTVSLLEKTQNQLVQSEKVASLGALVAGLSHEINTPLGVAVTATSIMKEEGEHLRNDLLKGEITQEKLQHFVDDYQHSTELVERSLQRVLHLTSNFKKIALTQNQSQRRAFLLSEILDEILLHHQQELNKRAIEITLTGTDDIQMNGYPGALSEVLNHLISNSLRHGFKRTSSPMIHISCSVTEDQLRMEFIDNGCGIRPEHMNKLFDPFFTTQIGQGSSGLGLSFVYNIVTGTLGGDIEISGDHGCRCQLQLPLVSPEATENATDNS